MDAGGLAKASKIGQLILLVLSGLIIAFLIVFNFTSFFGPMRS